MNRDSGREPLEAFFHPRSVALVGATGRPGSVGSILARNLVGYGRDRLVFVNPLGGEVEGLPVVPTIADMPDGVDLAVVAVPPAVAAEVMEGLGRKGVRQAVVITAGLGQGEGSSQEAMALAAGRHGIRLIGPNSAGFQVPAIGLNASFAQRAARKGDLAFISQSGTLTMVALDWAEKHQIGFSGLVSLGDACDLGFSAMLDHFALDHNTRAILLYVESIRDARAFMSAARAAARAKPVVVIKSGRHAVGARAAATHTGALAGFDGVYDTAFRRAGLLRVGDLGQMFAAAETLSLVPRINGKRFAVITNGGGVGVLAVDRIADLGGELATLSDETLAELDRVLPAGWSRGNPVDLLGNAEADRYASAMRIVLADKGVDAIIVMNCPTALAPSAAAAGAVVEAVAAYRRDHYGAKPVIAAWLGADDGWNAIFTKARIPVLETPNAAVEGLMQVVRHADAQAALTAAPADLLAGFSPDRARATRAIDAAIADGRSWLTASEVHDVISAYDIPSVPAVLCRSPSEARRESAALFADFRSLVAKVASPDIVHKSDVGGVELELATPDAVENASRTIIDRARAARPDARIDGVTLHPMILAPKAVELIAGVADDPVFGPVLVFGRGGTAVEVINDKALALPPLDINLALDLIERTRVSRQLSGYHDRKPVNKERLALILVKLAQLVAQEPRIREIDLNPLIADHARLIVVDARISVWPDTALDRPAPEKRVGHPRLAIRPYPTEWERQVLLPSGRRILMRPVRPEDEPLFLDFFGRMSEDDLRLRFFARVRDLGHAFIARLTQIDYNRAMAFVALDPDSGEMLGGVRLHGDPGHIHGEYAVSVRSDLKGLGLGWALMRQIIRFAEKEGFREVHGEVLRENGAMLALCQALGFRAKADPDSPEIMKVTLEVTEATTDAGRDLHV